MDTGGFSPIAQDVHISLQMATRLLTPFHSHHFLRHHLRRLSVGIKKSQGVGILSWYMIEDVVRSSCIGMASGPYFRLLYYTDTVNSRVRRNGRLSLRARYEMFILRVGVDVVKVFAFVENSKHKQYSKSNTVIITEASRQKGRTVTNTLNPAEWCGDSPAFPVNANSE